MEEGGIDIDISADFLIVVAVSVVSMRSMGVVGAMGVWGTVVVVMVVVMVTVVVVVMVVSMIVVYRVLVVMASLSVKKIFLERRVLDLIFGLIFLTVVVAVIVTMAVASRASTGSVVVIVLATEVVVPFTRVEDFHLDEVEDETHNRNNQHQVTFDLWWHEESLGRLGNEPDCHDPDARDRDERTDDLGSVPSVGKELGAFLLCKS